MKNSANILRCQTNVQIYVKISKRVFFKISFLKFHPVRSTLLILLFGLCVWVVIQVKKQRLTIANFLTLSFWGKDTSKYLCVKLAKGLTSAKKPLALKKYTLFFISNTFIGNARLKMAKNLAKAKQQPETELLLFQNYSLFSSTLLSKNNRRYSRKYINTKYLCLNGVIWLMTK